MPAHKKRHPLVRLLILLAWLLIGAVSYIFFYEPPYAGLVKIPDRMQIFAHRGFGNYAPDNSLVGAQMAMEEGFDGIDVDGQQSSDGEFVIFHDLSVDRLTHATGRVSSKSLAELKKLDLSEKFGKGFSGAYVATFEDFLKTTQGSGILMVELKVPGTERTGLEERAVEIVAKHDAFEQVYFSSFNPFVLYRLKQLDPRIRTVMIFMDTNWNPQLLAEIKPGDEVNLPWFIRQEWIRRGIRKVIKPDLLSVNVEVDEGTIDRLLGKGWPVFLWTPNNDEWIRYAVGKNPMAIISDEPMLTWKILQNATDNP
jgi:glycerophosphoryl diester phosphodiesterase